MEFVEQLRALQAAEGDPAKLALAAVDLAYPALPDGERSALREALAAAAIPHWCDAAILAALLGITAEEGHLLHARLDRLAVAEPFPARGETAVNVHEAARLALRKSLAADRSDWFRTLSGRAAEHFRNDVTAAARIEWTYHRLCAAPDDAANELAELDRDWSGTAHREDRQALAVALRELTGSDLLRARALLWASLCIAWARVARGETAQVGADARHVCQLARDLGDTPAEAQAECLLGDVLQAQGKLTEAEAAYIDDLAISRRLVELDPGNTGRHQDLAATLDRLAEVLQAQWKLGEAQAAASEALAIRRRLDGENPTSAG